jgi:predicted HTH domain antitoxin
LFAIIINCKQSLTTHKTVAARIPVELEEEITRFMEEEGVDKSTALRRMLEIGAGEWKRRRAVELYRSEKVTLWKASQIWGVSLREMLDELNRLRITAHVTAKDIEEDIEAARAAEAQAGSGAQ